MRTKRAIVIVFSYLTAAALNAASPGTSIFSFLKINPGARSAAIGDVIGMVTSQNLFSNPAVAAFDGRSELSIEHLQYLSEINYSAVHYVRNVGNNAAVMGSLGYLGAGGMTKTVYDSSKADGFSESGSLAYSDIVAAFGYSEKLSRSFSWGASLKALTETIDSNSASGLALSIGGYYFYQELRYRGPRQADYVGDWQLGVGIFDAGFPVKGYSLPTGGFLNYGYWFTKNAFWTAEIVSYIDQVSELRTGFEFDIYNTVAFRCGYRYPLSTRGIGSESNVNITGGIGFNLKRFSIDYAWVPYGDFGQSHRLTVVSRIGENNK